jgi:hypothetical protein
MLNGMAIGPSTSSGSNDNWQRGNWRRRTLRRGSGRTADGGGATANGDGSTANSPFDFAQDKQQGTPNFQVNGERRNRRSATCQSGTELPHSMVLSLARNPDRRDFLD